MRISVDAMGGDNAPRAIIEGCLEAAARKPDYSIQLIGDKAEILRVVQDELKTVLPESTNGGTPPIELLHCTETVKGDDSPTRAIKEKKDSSMVVGLSLIKDRITDAFISCGNTGALLAGAMLVAGRARGVDRPALAPMVPTATGRAMLIDAGLNANCKPINYEQFAQLGSMYMREIYKIPNPKVGLLNVGAEENKGTETVKEAYARLLELTDINFIGNVEGRDLTEGKCDVAVCDGFVGNIVLKLYESIGSFVKTGITEALTGSVPARLASLVVKRDLKSFFRKFDYEDYGGTPILGIVGSVFKCHGSAGSRAVTRAIERAAEFARAEIADKIEARFASAR